MSVCLRLTQDQSALWICLGNWPFAKRWASSVCRFASTETLFAREDTEFPGRVEVLGGVQVQVGVSRPPGEPVAGPSHILDFGFIQRSASLGETDDLREIIWPCHSSSKSVDYWLNCYISLSLWLYSPLDLGRFFSFLICTQSVGLLGRGISPSQGR
jgi:hypothetical protein